ncbi:UbiE/COQ5 methyltransferase [Pseudobythopirellula maris]|uniref:Demethylmenaquinone methyltransferase n=1 Tax=Pseudobythopirellula maris TaxID=2527991 RepID=A0A5C5ZK42_9BACT|nr:bifunctional demethylmenaquinone methyltransferase/2-methoxy-6-polyprenyl-1,4-benzoquinol methylase UbiE [Pseudobythopirellula maris]TWT87417.1 UbiE/COQ5 methyltransferase [Pseudobythopirellula maris]
MPAAPANAPHAPAQPVDKSTERVRQMFGEIAPRYDLLNHLLSMNIDKLWRRFTVRKVAPQFDGPAGGKPILDLCTGTGDLALAYDRAAKGKLPITAADFCPEMLEIGRKKGSKSDANDRVTWIEADAERLPFEDNTYQIVSVAFGLRNVADTDQGLREMTRVCASGGKIAVLEFTTPRRQPLRGMYGWYFRNVLPRIGQTVMRNNSAAYEYLPASVGQFYEYEQLTERMEAAGLKNVAYYPLTFGVATLYVGEKN